MPGNDVSVDRATGILRFAQDDKSNIQLNPRRRLGEQLSRHERLEKLYLPLRANAKLTQHSGHNYGVALCQHHRFHASYFNQPAAFDRDQYLY